MLLDIDLTTYVDDFLITTKESIIDHLEKVCSIFEVLQKKFYIKF